MKLNQLTFTRFVAALFVILYHHVKGFSIFSNANVFVSYFYILSGFVLVLSQKQEFTTKKEYSIFYLNRFARIYPLFLFSTLLFVFIENEARWDLLLNILGIHSFFPKYALNYNVPSWSISVELFFYFSFPFLIRYFYNRYSLKTVLWVTICFWLICQFIFSIIYYQLHNQYNETLLFLKYNPINHINEFICGGAAALLFKRKAKEWQGNYDLILIILYAVIIMYLSYWKNSLNLFDHNGLLILFFIPAILLLSLNTGFITKLFKNRFFILAGEISFSMYILAEPILHGLIKIFKTYNLPRTLYLQSSLFVIIGISILMYFLFEKPMQRVIKYAGTNLLTLNKQSRFNGNKIAKLK